MKISTFKTQTSTILKSPFFRWICVLSILGFVSGVAIAAAPDPTTDLLSGARDDISTNFGPTSNFAYILYIVEVISGLAAYIKTKNLFALVGIVVVVIFTSVAFHMIGGG